MNYQEFILTKTPDRKLSGFDPILVHDFLFDFQKNLVVWAIKSGKAAIFADCVSGDTLVSTLHGDIKIQELAARKKSIDLWSLDFEGNPIIARATCPWINGYDSLYRIELKSGKTIDATLRHRLLTSSGWKSVSSLQIGECLQVCDVSHLPSNLELSRLVHHEDDRNFWNRVSDLKLSYSTCFHPYDEQLHLGEDNAQYSFLLQDDALEHNPHERLTSELVRSSSGHKSRAYSLKNPPEFDTITAIYYTRKDWFYDIHVPKFENYLANGIWSHNCGLGKSPIQLSWADNVVRKENKPVLIITPLAVSAQTVREGEKFGIECTQTRDGTVHKGINVTNYERLHYFKPEDFVGVVCDESSSIKCFTTKRRKDITEFLSNMKYRLLCTATAAPNDYIELGTSSEALGQMGRMDMLATFFKNDENSLHPIWWGSKWRIKKHSERPFWRWVCSWARAIRKPSDLGFKDGKFKLPELIINQTMIPTSIFSKKGFFPKQALTLQEQRDERKGTIRERCEKVAEIISSRQGCSIVWCHMNVEGDLLEKIIPEAVQVQGSDKDEEKEKRFLDFADGKIKVLVTKPRIGGFGMNFQHCSSMTFFPSHSFESWYQCIRRCWRFGQKNPVKVDIVTTPGEAAILKNLQRKEAAASLMFDNLVSEMNHSLSMKSNNGTIEKLEYPKWLR